MRQVSNNIIEYLVVKEICLNFAKRALKMYRYETTEDNKIHYQS